MKRIVFLGCLLLATGCTQSIASRAMDDGLDHAHAVYVNTSDMTKQLILNAGAEKAAEAAAAGNTEAAVAAVQEVFDNMQNLGYLNIQWERARSLLRVAQEYIWSQKNIVQILKDEMDEIEVEEPPEE